MPWDEHRDKLPPGESINSWPSCLNNVCWSKDNIIAVGGEEVVTLLVPKHRRQKAEDAIWDKITLHAGQFTNDEFPLQLPLTWKNFSIGEEQSEACVTALDWSPPGLAKHRRCVLAVLTSNHALSLWECTGRPEDSTNWERVFVVNHTLQAYNQAHDQPLPGESRQDKWERLKFRQRIRTFAWSQALSTSPTPGQSGACDTISQPFLAISTESGDVYVLALKTPHDILTSNTTEWSAAVIQTYQFHTNSSMSLAASLPPTSVEPKAFVDQLAWSPWSRDANGTLSSVLAFTAQEALQCKIIRAHVHTNGINLELGTTVPHLVDDKVAQSAGPMRWVPKPTTAEDLYLVYPCRKMIYCLVFHLKKASGIRPTKCQLSNTWDEFSGIAFATNQQDKPYIQLTYHLGSIAALSSGLSLPLTGEPPLPTAPWQQELKEAQAHFSKDYDLQNKVMTRTYGIGASPLGDSFAVSSSFHPSDGVEYIVHSDHLSTLGITPASQDTGNDILPPLGGPSHPCEMSSEAVLGSLQRFFERDPNTEPVSELLVSQILRALDLVDVHSTPQNQVSIPEDTPINSIVSLLRRNILFHSDSIVARAERLATFVSFGKARRSPPLDPIVIRRVATEVVQLPHFVAEASLLSQTISRIHSVILAKLDAREGRGGDEHLSDIDDVDVEQCEICGDNIPFESLRWAQCPNDHQFTRCGLTFLAIQVSGAAKSCGICNMQYLNEYVVPGLKHLPPNEDIEMPDSLPSEDGVEPAVAKQGGSDQEPLGSLARVLLAACDRCVCCGGKFTG